MGYQASAFACDLQGAVDALQEEGEGVGVAGVLEGVEEIALVALPCGGLAAGCEDGTIAMWNGDGDDSSRIARANVCTLSVSINGGRWPSCLYYLHVSPVEIGRGARVVKKTYLTLL